MHEAAEFSGTSMQLLRLPVMFLPFPVHLLHRHFRIDIVVGNTHRRCTGNFNPSSSSINELATGSTELAILYSTASMDFNFDLR